LQEPKEQEHRPWVQVGGDGDADQQRQIRTNVPEGSGELSAIESQRVSRLGLVRHD
jgi:hypothetical protein